MRIINKRNQITCIFRSPMYILFNSLLIVFFMMMTWRVTHSEETRATLVYRTIKHRKVFPTEPKHCLLWKFTPPLSVSHFNWYFFTFKKSASIRNFLFVYRKFSLSLFLVFFYSTLQFNVCVERTHCGVCCLNTEPVKRIPKKRLQKNKGCFRADNYQWLIIPGGIINILV